MRSRSSSSNSRNTSRHGVETESNMWCDDSVFLLSMQLQSQGVVAAAFFLWDVLTWRVESKMQRRAAGHKHTQTAARPKKSDSHDSFDSFDWIKPTSIPVLQSNLFPPTGNHLFIESSHRLFMSETSESDSQKLNQKQLSFTDEPSFVHCSAVSHRNNATHLKDAGFMFCGKRFQSQIPHRQVQLSCHWKWLEN